jgi:membrane protease YdiL (CAAX protease family)
LSAPGTPANIGDFPWQTRLVLSIGAGIYEELLFRMVAIALVHFVVVDLLRFSHRAGAISAILISAFAFTSYHGVLDGGEAGVQWASAVFFFLSGLYFAGLFVVRGFGIAVGVHAAYDILVTVLAAIFPHVSG